MESKHANDKNHDEKENFDLEVRDVYTRCRPANRKHTEKDDKTSICYLKTQSMRFKAFKLKADGARVDFLKEDRKTGKLTVSYSNSLEEVHVKIGPKEKCPDTNNTLYSVVLSLPQKKTRAVYFDNVTD